MFKRNILNCLLYFTIFKKYYILKTDIFNGG